MNWAAAWAISIITWAICTIIATMVSASLIAVSFILLGSFEFIGGLVYLGWLEEKCRVRNKEMKKND